LTRVFDRFSPIKFERVHAFRFLDVGTLGVVFGGEI